MRLQNALLALGLMASASAASARCWMECVLPNPISGGCGKYIRVCDSNPGEVGAAIGGVIKGAEDRIIANWHKAYGEIPAPLRVVLDHYPLTLSCLVVPGTSGYILAAAAIDRLVDLSKDRDDTAAPVLQGAPDWKRNQIAAAEKYLMTLDISEINITDWNSPDAKPMHDRFAVPYGAFLDCVNRAATIPEGKQCYTRLVQDAAALVGS